MVGSLNQRGNSSQNSGTVHITKELLWHSIWLLKHVPVDCSDSNTHREIVNFTSVQVFSNFSTSNFCRNTCNAGYSKMSVKVYQNPQNFISTNNTTSKAVDTGTCVLRASKHQHLWATSIFCQPVLERIWGRGEFSQFTVKGIILSPVYT